VSQVMAFRPMTYWWPSPAIEPVSITVLPVRWQTSRVTAAVNRSSPGTTHPLQCLAHPALGQQVEKRRLLELDREPLFERVVEDGKDW